MQYMYSVFIKYMYTSIKPFPNFLNMSGLNGVDICDVTLTSVRGAGGGGGGGGGARYCDNMWSGATGWKGWIWGNVINRQPLMTF